MFSKSDLCSYVGLEREGTVEEEGRSSSAASATASTTAAGPVFVLADVVGVDVIAARNTRISVSEEVFLLGAKRLLYRTLCPSVRVYVRTSDMRVSAC